MLDVPPSVVDASTIDPDFGPQVLSLEDLADHTSAPADGISAYSLASGLWLINERGTQTQIGSATAGAPVTGAIRRTYLLDHNIQTVSAASTAILTFPMAEKSVALFRFELVARQPAGTEAGDSAGYIVQGAAKRHTGGVVTVLPSMATTSYEDAGHAATWNATVASDGGGNLLLNVVGEAAESVEWWGIGWLRYMQTLT